MKLKQLLKKQLVKYFNYSQSSTNNDTLLILPGFQLSTWNTWYKNGEEWKLCSRDSIFPHLVRKKIFILPLQYILCWPIWVAAVGDTRRLAILELLSKRILKIGMESSLHLLPICEENGRKLVLALYPEDAINATDFPNSWQTSNYFFVSAWLHKSPADIWLYQELGTYYAVFFRHNSPVFFTAVPKHNTASFLFRISLTLVTEQVLSHFPQKIDYSNIENELYLETTWKEYFPELVIQYYHFHPHENLENIPSIMPKSIFLEKRNIRRKKIFKNVIFSLIVIEILFIILTFVDLFLTKNKLCLLTHINHCEEKSLENAQRIINLYQEISPAMDPSKYAVDILLQITKITFKYNIKLNLINLEQKKICMTGESSTISPIYSFIEAIKKISLFKNYIWETPQPELISSKNIHFVINGLQK